MVAIGAKHVSRKMRIANSQKMNRTSTPQKMNRMSKCFFCAINASFNDFGRLDYVRLTNLKAIPMEPTHDGLPLPSPGTAQLLAST